MLVYKLQIILTDNMLIHYDTCYKLGLRHPDDPDFGGGDCGGGCCGGDCGL